MKFGQIPAKELLSCSPHACCWGKFANHIPGTTIGTCGKRPKPGEIWQIVDGRPYCQDCYKRKTNEDQSI